MSNKQTNVKTSPQSKSARKRANKKKKTMQIVVQPKVTVQTAPVKKRRTRLANMKYAPGNGYMMDNKIIRAPKNAKNYNCYIHQLLDPEHADLCSYPDKDSRHTAVIRPIVNQTLHFTSQIYGQTPAGTFSVQSFPQYNEVALELFETSLTQTGFFPVQITARASDPNASLVNLQGVKDSTGEMTLNNNFKNLLGPAYYDTAPDTAVSLNRFTGTAGEFFGLPGLGVAYTNSAFFGTLYINSINSFATTHVITYNIIDRTGILKTAAFSPAAISNNLVIPNIFQAVPAGDLGFPGVGIQIRVSDPGGQVLEWAVSSIELRGYVGLTPTGGGNSTIFYRPIDFVDKIPFNNIATEVRVIAMSSLITFQGNTLENGGRIAATWYGGGKSPGDAQLYEYDNISIYDDSASNPLMEGIYSYWKPTDDVTMRFKPTNLEAEYSDGYIVQAGEITTLTNTKALRLKIVMIIELTTRSQLMTTVNSRTNMAEILQAQAMISNFPTSMGNPEHMEAIRRFLNSVGQVVLDTGKFVYNNWDSIKPFAQALMTAAGMVL